MPWTPKDSRALFTSSSLNGLMTAVMSFIGAPSEVRACEQFRGETSCVHPLLGGADAGAGVEAAAREGPELVGRLGVRLEVDAGDLGLLVDPEADRLVDDRADDVGEDERERQHRAGRDGLPPELVDATAVEQAVDAGRGLIGGQDADEQGAGQAADQVDTDDVERVVVAP